jgi:hypothetical protein
MHFESKKFFSPTRFAVVFLLDDLFYRDARKLASLPPSPRATADKSLESEGEFFSFTQGWPADGPTLGFVTKSLWGFQIGEKDGAKGGVSRRCKH